MEGLFWLLLPVAAYSGWYVAMKQFKNPESPSQQTPKNTAGYSEGIENFLAEQPDRAVDIVINKLEVTAETVEVHMALGNLYRRTGEVDRAIRLHQNLTEKLSLNPMQREQVLYELGLDYLSSGLLDRAELIFKDLLNTKSFAASSAKALAELYQQEKDWVLSIEYLNRYQSLSGQSKNTVISQFYCEIAEKEIIENNSQEATKFLNKALEIDKNCVRANMMSAEIYYNDENYTQALKYYQATVKQDSAFLSEVIEPVVNCLLAISQQQSLSTNIPNLLDQYFNASDEVAMNGLASKGKDNNKKALKFIEQKLDVSPSVKLLGQYLYLNMDNSSPTKDRQMVAKIRDVLKTIGKKEAGYRCHHCGFMSHTLHWQCPSCSEWSSIKPV